MISLYMQITITEIMAFVLVAVSIAAYFAYRALRRKNSTKKR